MKYDTVEIRPRSIDRKKLYIVCTKDNTEREDGHDSENPFAFYHYPRTMGVNDAVEKLRASMVREVDAQIEHLQGVRAGILSAKREGTK